MVGFGLTSSVAVLPVAEKIVDFRVWSMPIIFAGLVLALEYQREKENECSRDCQSKVLFYRRLFFGDEGVQWPILQVFRK